MNNPSASKKPDWIQRISIHGGWRAPKVWHKLAPSCSAPVCCLQTKQTWSLTCKLHLSAEELGQGYTELACRTTCWRNVCVLPVCQRVCVGVYMCFFTWEVCRCCSCSWASGLRPPHWEASAGVTGNTAGLPRKARRSQPTLPENSTTDTHTVRAMDKTLGVSKSVLCSN